jgi:hypothetical protein
VGVVVPGVVVRQASSDGRDGQSCQAPWRRGKEKGPADSAAGDDQAQDTPGWGIRFKLHDLGEGSGGRKFFPGVPKGRANTSRAWTGSEDGSDGHPAERPGDVMAATAGCQPVPADEVLDTGAGVG